MYRIGVVLLLSTLAGCTTKFWGSAMVPNGPAGCKAACDGWGMELAGMVKMGEYSDGCICQVKPKAPAAGQPPASGVPGSPSAAVIPAAAGVSMQMEDEQRQASQPAPGVH